MGDRGNIVVIDRTGKPEDRDRVYLYAHWRGSDLPAILQSALKRGAGRWDDPPYLARIIFSEMIAGDLVGTTGFGIGSRMCDNEYPLLVVDCEKETVSLEAEPDGSHAPRVPRSWTIQQYIELPSPADFRALDPVPADTEA